MEIEEEKAIKEAKKQIEEHHNWNNVCCFMTDTTTLKTLVNIVEKQGKIIDLMAEEIVEYEEDLEYEYPFKDKEEVKQYFKNKVEED